MFQPAPLSFFEMDDFTWNVWTQSLGTIGRIGLELVDDFVGIRKRVFVEFIAIDTNLFLECSILAK
jgi:hypothetical protein